MTSQTDGRGQTLVFAYNNLHQPTTVREGSAVGPVVASWTYGTTAPERGRLVSSMSQTSFGAGGAGQLTTTYSHDLRGRLTAAEWDMPSALNDPFDGHYDMAWGYGPNDVVTSTAFPPDPTFSPGLVFFETTYTTYDPRTGAPRTMPTDTNNGAPGYVSNTVYDNEGRVTSLHGLWNFERRFSYQGDTGRLSNVQMGSFIGYGAPDLRNVTYTYDFVGNVTSILDAFNSNQRQCFVYDDLDRLDRAWTTNAACNYSTPNPVAVGTGSYDETYVQNTIGNLTSRTAGAIGGVNVGTYTYPTTVTAGVPDRYHAVTSTSTGDSFAYDDNGNMVTRTVDSVTQRLTYDTRNRADTLLAPNAAARYGFDADGTRVLRAEYGTPNALGAAVQAAAPRVLFVVANPGTLTAGETTLRNRLIADGYAVTNHDDAAAAPAVSTYDVAVLSPTVVTATVGTKYRDVARPVVNLAPATWVNNELISVTPSAAATTRAQVDNATHPIAQGNLAGTDVTVSSSQSWSYADDTQINASADRVWNWRPATGATTFPTRNTVFVYDTGDTLDNAAPAPASRVAVGTSAGALNGLTAAGLNLVAHAINYGTGPATTVTLPGWEQHRYATSAVQVTNYTHGGQSIGYRRSNGTFSDYHQTYNDHIGSTTGVMDFVGNVFHHLTQRYGPYGNTLPGSANTTTDHQYTGQTNDRPTGLYHYGYRNYDPITARFTQPDSIVPGVGNPQNLNRYTYTNNNPITYNDPTGHIPIYGSETHAGGDPHDTSCITCRAAPGTKRTNNVTLGDGYDNPEEFLNTTLSALLGGYASDASFAVTSPKGVSNNLAYAYLNNALMAGIIEALPNGYGLVECGGYDYCSSWVQGGDAVQAIIGQTHWAWNIVLSETIISMQGTVSNYAASVAMSPGRGSNSVDSVYGAVCSFSGDTRVLMADRTTKRISEIGIGDEVLAYDPETGERGPREVTHLWVHQDTVVDLEVGGATVTTTEDHPFWNASDGAWQRADTLDPGEMLLTADGDYLQVAGLDWASTRPTTVYNLTIDGIHTYYVAVGSHDVLVHNTCPWQLKFDPNFGNLILDGPLPQTGQLSSLTRGELLDLQSALTTSIANRQMNLWDGTFPTNTDIFRSHAARVDLEVGLLSEVNKLLG